MITSTPTEWRINRSHDNLELGSIKKWFDGQYFAISSIRARNGDVVSDLFPSVRDAQGWLIDRAAKQNNL